MGGLEAAEGEFLDLLAGKGVVISGTRAWTRRTRSFWPEQEQGPALAALVLWRHPATRPLRRKLRWEQAWQENRHPLVSLGRIRPGAKVLYRERTILPAFDRIWFEENRPLAEEMQRRMLAGELRLHRRSPAAFIQVHPDDPGWFGLNDPSCRIYLRAVLAVSCGRTFVGCPRWSEALYPAQILEVLPDEF